MKLDFNFLNNFLFFSLFIIIIIIIIISSLLLLSMILVGPWEMEDNLYLFRMFYL